jgi:hypothetical protein
VEKTVPLTGQRTARPPSSEVSFSKDTTAIFLNMMGSPAVSAAVRTGVLEAHPTSTVKAMQRAATNAGQVLEEVFTVSPRQECLRLVNGRNNEQKKKTRGILFRTLLSVFPGADQQITFIFKGCPSSKGPPGHVCSG